MLKFIFFAAKILTAIGDAVISLFALSLKAIDKISNATSNLIVSIIKKLQSSKLSFKKPHKRDKEIYNRKKSVGNFYFLTKLKYFFLGITFSFFFIFIPLVSLIFIQELPSPKSLSIEQLPQTTKIYDRNGNLLYQIYANQNRTLVPLSLIPTYLKEATIAIEDKNFYTDPGIDLAAILRASINDLEGHSLQGGSTITQQLIKSSLLTPQTSIMRKIKEAILAFWAEKIYTKDQILEMYFNQIPYGGMAWGAQAAAQTYFGKDIKNLDLAQCAFLAGLPRAPSEYSPFGTHPDLWKKRQIEVLQRMTILGYITKQQEKQAENEALHFKSPQIPIHAPHFVMYVKNLLVKKYGLAMVEKGGLTVVTSLNLKLQDMAQKIVTEEVSKDSYFNLTNGAALITNPKNGDILAMVGSRDYNYPGFGAVNVTTSLRQPGSSIKVVTYAAALSRGFTAATLINDSPVVYSSPGAPPYAPVNYDHRFHGMVTLRTALANSINVPAVKTLNKIGIPAMVSMAKKMGITTFGNPKNYGLSITLGAADVKMTDMAVVYGVLANGGIKVNLNPILKVTDSKGNILEEKRGTDDGKRVLDQGVAFILSNILSDNNARSMEFGINSPLNIPGYTVSVKTGTTNNIRDNWTIGYTPSYVTAVWVGNDNNAPMNNIASGITGAAPIWHKIMLNLLKIKPEKPMALPSDIIEKPCLGRMEYFIKGTENSVNCNYAPTITPTPTNH